jgi:hypothetical protein
MVKKTLNIWLQDIYWNNYVWSGGCETNAQKDVLTILSNVTI